VVLAFEGEGHLERLQIEKPDIMVVTRGYEEQDLVSPLLFHRLALGLGTLSPGARWRLVLILVRLVEQLAAFLGDFLVTLEIIHGSLFCSTASFFYQLHTLHFIYFMAVKPHHQLRIDRFVVFGVVGDRVVVLLVFEVVYSTFVGYDAVVDVFIVDQALLKPILSTSHQLRLRLLSLLLFLLRCLWMPWIVVHLLEIVIFDEFLHFEDYVGFAYHILAIFLLIVALVA